MDEYSFDKCEVCVSHLGRMQQVQILSSAHRAKGIFARIVGGQLKAYVSIVRRTRRRNHDDRSVTGGSTAHKKKNP